jgi:hypothetical protein
VDLLTTTDRPIVMFATTAARDAVHSTTNRSAFLGVTHVVRHIPSSDVTVSRGGLPADGPRVYGWGDPMTPLV